MSKMSEATQDESTNGSTNAAPATKHQKMRRRLTVTGASDTIDGVASLSVADNATQHERSIVDKCAVMEYSGVSKKGHTPYNHRKKNQDALILAEDATLCSGYGEHGDGVANFHL